MPAPWYDTGYGRQVIKGLGGKVTPEKLRFFQAWALAEGTEAQYNPFATTRKGYPGETSFNSVGVKNYTSRDQGIQATIDTLSLDYYKHIVGLIRSNDVTAEELAAAVAKSPWGTGAGVLRVLGVTQSDGYEKTTSTVGYGQSKGQLEEQYQTMTLDRFRPSEAYMRSLEQMGEAGAPALRVARGFQPFTVTRPVPQSQPVEGGNETTPTVAGFTPGGKIYQLPYTWSGTHVTDNLDLNSGAKTAIDIMLDPGTPVGAPEAGTIIRLGSAQGGSALYFKGRSGRTYWLGHIDNIHKAGTKVKKGQAIAVVSSDHDAPHAHWDATPPPRRKK